MSKPAVKQIAYTAPSTANVSSVPAVKPLQAHIASAKTSSAASGNVVAVHVVPKSKATTADPAVKKPVAAPKASVVPKASASVAAEPLDLKARLLLKLASKVAAPAASTASTSSVSSASATSVAVKPVAKAVKPAAQSNAKAIDLCDSDKDREEENSPIKVNT